MNKKATLTSKLKVYSAMAAVSAVGVSAHAEIVYTDIDPDSVSQNDATVFINMDNAGGDEFYMFAGQGLFSSGNYGYAWAPVGPYASGAEIASGTQGAYYQYVAAKSAGSLIGSLDIFWSPASAGDNAILGQNYYVVSGGTYFGTVGNFWNTGDKYLGVKFLIDTVSYHGWIRVNLWSDTLDSARITLRVMDYAYEDSVTTGDSVGLPILAGNIGMNLDTITPVALADSGDANNASDLMISFDGINNPVEEYRVFIVPAGTAFTDSMAIALDSTHYASVAPNIINNSYMMSIPAATLASDGSVIANGNTYEAYVLAISPVDTMYNTLSMVSNAVELATEIIPVDGVKNNLTSKATIWNAGKNVYVNLKETGKADMRVYALNGALVHTTALTGRSNTIQLAGLTSGVYVVVVNVGGEMVTRKIVL